MTVKDMKAAIRRAFRLRQDGTAWVAEWLRPDASVFAVIRGDVRADVISQVRSHWGHFNYRAEAETFAEIFPPQW